MADDLNLAPRVPDEAALPNVVFTPFPRWAGRAPRPGGLARQEARAQERRDALRWIVLGFGCLADRDLGGARRAAVAAAGELDGIGDRAEGLAAWDEVRINLEVLRAHVLLARAATEPEAGAARLVARARTHAVAARDAADPSRPVRAVTQLTCMAAALETPDEPTGGRDRSLDPADASRAALAREVLAEMRDDDARLGLQEWAECVEPENVLRLARATGESSFVDHEVERGLRCHGLIPSHAAAALRLPAETARRLVAVGRNAPAQHLRRAGLHLQRATVAALASMSAAVLVVVAGALAPEVWPWRAVPWMGLQETVSIVQLTGVLVAVAVLALMTARLRRRIEAQAPRPPDLGAEFQDPELERAAFRARRAWWSASSPVLLAAAAAAVPLGPRTGLGGGAGLPVVTVVLLVLAPVALAGVLLSAARDAGREMSAEVWRDLPWRRDLVDRDPQRMEAGRRVFTAGAPGQVEAIVVGATAVCLPLVVSLSGWGHLVAVLLVGVGLARLAVLIPCLRALRRLHEPGISHATLGFAGPGADRPLIPRLRRQFIGWTVAVVAAAASLAALACR